MTAIALLLACLAGCPMPAAPAPVPEPVHWPAKVWLGVDCSPGAAAFEVSLAEEVQIAECETE